MYITRLAAAAARAFGMLGGVIQPVVTSITSGNQNSLTVNWTNKSTTNQILIYVNNVLNATIAANSTSGTITSLTCNTTYQISLAYNFGGTPGPRTNNQSATVTPLANGTYLSQYCSGCSLIYSYSNGSCGTYTTNQGYNGSTCCPLQVAGVAYADTSSCGNYGCNAYVLLHVDGPGIGGDASGFLCYSGSAFVGYFYNTGSYYIYGGVCNQGADLTLSLYRSFPNEASGSWNIGCVQSCGYYSYGGYGVYIT